MLPLAAEANIMESVTYMRRRRASVEVTEKATSAGARAIRYQLADHYGTTAGAPRAHLHIEDSPPVEARAEYNPRPLSPRERAMTMGPVAPSKFTARDSPRDIGSTFAVRNG